MRFALDKDDDYPWVFSGIGQALMMAINTWCIDQFGPMPPYDRWCTDVHSGNGLWSYSIHFKHEEDALWFKLRWYEAAA